MTKFKADDDPAFLAVAAELRRWSKSLPGPERISLPSSDFFTVDQNDRKYHN